MPMLKIVLAKTHTFLAICTHILLYGIIRVVKQIPHKQASVVSLYKGKGKYEVIIGACPALSLLHICRWEIPV